MPSMMVAGYEGSDHIYMNMNIYKPLTHITTTYKKMSK